MRVVIDPGHGGTDPGAIGASGTLEKDVNLSLSLLLRESLRKCGIEVFLTRENDTTLSISERVVMIRTCKPDLMLSIHHNAGGDLATGSEALYRSSGIPKPGEVELAKALATGVAATLSISYRRVLAHEHGVLRSDCVAVTLESGFLSNPVEERLLKDPDTQRNLAESITRIVIAHFGLSQGQHQEMDAIAIWRDGAYVCDGILHNGTSYAPVRKFAEALGLQVDWNGAERMVVLTTKDIATILLRIDGAEITQLEDGRILLRAKAAQE
ncbi:MAG: N-acetylmuramoyl-L-alanine amidase [Symbiobacteriaceae bacterium]|nr:N-acetylmuramoyl-L-alanine amidase [Symbiobacteriaceae bacterium]